MSALSPLMPPFSEADERRSWKPVLESQLDLLRDGVFSDVTFIVGPSKERIPCHQLFLKARSPVFQVMFSEHWNHHKEIPLEDVHPNIFTKFLQFMYADNFDGNVSEVLGLLQVAHKYDVRLLVDKCEKFLDNELSMTHAVDVFQAARKYGKIHLMQKSEDLISKSLSELQSLPSFSRLDKETLTTILKRNDLEIRELDLFHLAIQWAKNQSGLTAQQSLKDILPHIRFPLMTLREFTKNVVPTCVLSPSRTIQLFTYFGSDTDTKKSIAGALEFSTQRRKSPDYIVSVPIYSGDYENKDVMSYFYGCKRLMECLHFWLRYPNNHRCDGEQETDVGLKGISVYCPRDERCYGEGHLTNFKIQLMETDRWDGIYPRHDQNYKDFPEMPPVEMEAGKVTEIKFETVTPVNHETLYCIKIEEVTSSLLYKNTDGLFRVIDFGCIAESIDVNIRKKAWATLNIRRNIRTEFACFLYWHRPQLICKLTFEEL